MCGADEKNGLRYTYMGHYQQTWVERLCCLKQHHLFPYPTHSKAPLLAHTQTQFRPVVCVPLFAHTLKSVNPPFPLLFAGRWFSTQQEDGRICRELYPGSSTSRVAYEVTLVTSDLRGAGTDANVHVQLHGSLGDGVRHELVANQGQLER
jgi:hypothetical protein